MCIVKIQSNYQKTAMVATWFNDLHSGCVFLLTNLLTDGEMKEKNVKVQLMILQGYQTFVAQICLMLDSTKKNYIYMIYISGFKSFVLLANKLKNCNFLSWATKFFFCGRSQTHWDAQNNDRGIECKYFLFESYVVKSNTLYSCKQQQCCVTDDDDLGEKIHKFTTSQNCLI